MSLVPRNSLFDFDNFLDRGWSPLFQLNSGLSAFSPRVDIVEKNDVIEITAELPGVSKEDISVTLKNGVLGIEAETKHEEKQTEEGKIIRQERRYGKYTRTFDLGNAVQESDIIASFKDGVLTLTAPKAEHQATNDRKIKITE